MVKMYALQVYFIGSIPVISIYHLLKKNGCILMVDSWIVSPKDTGSSPVILEGE